MGLWGEAPLSGEPPAPIDRSALSCPTTSLRTPHNQFYPWIEKKGHIGEPQLNTSIKSPSVPLSQETWALQTSPAGTAHAVGLHRC